MSTTSTINQWWQYHTEYYYDAFSDDYRNIWRGLEPTTEDVYWRCYYRALMVFLRSDPDAVMDRRRLLYAYLQPEFKTVASTDTLNRYRKQLPIDSRVRRVINNICTAYDEPPTRVWGDERGGLLYEALDADTVMPRIYKRARMTGMVAARPVYKTGRWFIDYMTPDHFTIETDPDDWRTMSAITYVQSTRDDGIEYVTWTADSIITTGYNGRQVSEQPNPYGRIPWVLLRLGEDDGVWTAGMIELVESQLDVNKAKWLSSVNLTFAGQPVWVATNFNAGNLTFSPDKVITIDGVRLGEGMDAPPQLDVVSPEPAYQMIDDFSRLREQMMQQAEGIPASMVRDGNGEPPSGVARMIERQELTELRYADQKSLRAFEYEFSEVVATVARVDAGVTVADQPLESISYADEGVVMDPAEEYALDKQKLADLVMSPEAFYKKWAGIDAADLASELANRRGQLSPEPTQSPVE